AEIGESLNSQGKEPPTGVNRQIRTSQMVATLIVGDETLTAACHPSYRPLQATRRPSQHGLLGVMLTLVAEATADIGGDDAQCRLRYADLFAAEPAYLLGHLGAG